MEKLILTSGRFTPRAGDGMEARLRDLETYLAEMSEELELLVARLGQMQAATAAEAQKEG